MEKSPGMRMEILKPGSIGNSKESKNLSFGNDSHIVGGGT